MNYPLISEYIDSIKSAEDNFKELSYLRPVLGDDGLPIMTSGNFAVVFKMKDERDGKLYALKCFTKEQRGREEAYCEISKELKDISSSYIVSIQYLEKELFVDTNQTPETEFPVLLMDWVEGKTLDKYLCENLDDKYALEMLAYRFSQLAQWLIPQPFAHGDLKPDNILVREDETLVLVVYDGMYVPAMKGQKARELGSPAFRHPARTENDFDEHIDDFAFLSMLLSLKTLSLNPYLLQVYGAVDRLLFSEDDYRTGDWLNIYKIHFFNVPFVYKDEYLNTLVGLFYGLCKKQYHFILPTMPHPYKEYDSLNNIKGLEFIGSPSFIEEVMDNSISVLHTAEDVIDGLIKLDNFLKINNINYVLSGSLCLFFHGFVPNGYIPHDIDILIQTDITNYSRICHQFSNIETLSKGNIHKFYPETMYSFNIAESGILVNAFIHNEPLNEDSYKQMIICGHKISVHNLLAALERKFILRREKDYIFNNQIQNMLNGFLDSNLGNNLLF